MRPPLVGTAGDGRVPSRSRRLFGSPRTMMGHARGARRGSVTVKIPSSRGGNNARPSPSVPKRRLAAVRPSLVRQPVPGC
jgi:hypothetical protein